MEMDLELTPPKRLRQQLSPTPHPMGKRYSKPVLGLMGLLGSKTRSCPLQRRQLRQAYRSLQRRAHQPFQPPRCRRVQPHSHQPHPSQHRHWTGSLSPVQQLHRLRAPQRHRQVHTQPRVSFRHCRQLPRRRVDVRRRLSRRQVPLWLLRHSPIGKAMPLSVAPISLPQFPWCTLPHHQVARLMKRVLAQQARCTTKSHPSRQLRWSL